ncbi:MAG: hypothetical protein GY696_26915 [Gammaproteobacteria bacterium]|nr:hypothetical protein [Gammaproteobacteria bacterium]
MSGSTRHLLVPGLLGPMPRVECAGLDLNFPLLSKLLSRGEFFNTPGEDYESTLLFLFGLEHQEGTDLPTAALRRLGESGISDNRIWMQVDPVYLRPDHDRLLLFDTLDLDLKLEEAQELARLLESHFVDEGWKIEIHSPHHWYLSLPASVNIATRSLGAAYGRNIDMFIPVGVDQRFWRSALNEVQMLFYTAEVNQQRELNGKLPVNGVWFSGVGELPSVASSFDFVSGEGALCRGLAQCAAIPHRLPGEKFDWDVADEKSAVVIYSQLERPVWQASPQEWQAGLQQFEQWLVALPALLKSNRSSSVRLYFCDGRGVELSHHHLRRFWRRNEKFQQHLSGE